MIAAQSDLHDVLRRESSLVGGIGDQGRYGGANCKDARLGRIDDGRKVVDIIHAQVGDGECSTLETRQDTLS